MFGVHVGFIYFDLLFIRRVKIWNPFTFLGVVFILFDLLFFIRSAASWSVLFAISSFWPAIPRYSVGTAMWGPL